MLPELERVGLAVPADDLAGLQAAVRHRGHAANAAGGTTRHGSSEAVIVDTVLDGDEGTVHLHVAIHQFCSPLGIICVPARAIEGSTDSARKPGSAWFPARQKQGSAVVTDSS